VRRGQVLEAMNYCERFGVPYGVSWTKDLQYEFMVPAVVGQKLADFLAEKEMPVHLTFDEIYAELR